jgi:hypothetical protein
VGIPMSLFASPTWGTDVIPHLVGCFCFFVIGLIVLIIVLSFRVRWLGKENQRLREELAMTEAEWLGATYSTPMLELIKASGRV